jgi:nicotinic acid phosphoribosyltransferase
MKSSLPYKAHDLFAVARDEAEITTLLNNDVYKFLMLDFILAHPEYRDLIVRWKMKIRSKDVRTLDIIPEEALREQLDAVKNIR